jgi:hypothetical protein
VSLLDDCGTSAAEEPACGGFKRRGPDDRLWTTAGRRRRGYAFASRAVALDDAGRKGRVDQRIGKTVADEHGRTIRRGGTRSGPASIPSAASKSSNAASPAASGSKKRRREEGRHHGAEDDDGDVDRIRRLIDAAVCEAVRAALVPNVRPVDISRSSSPLGTGIADVNGTAS